MPMGPLDARRISASVSNGARALVRLAATLQDPGVAAGLDTLRALAEDVVEEEVSLDGGEVHAWGLEETGVTVRVDRLEHVTGG